MSKSWADDSWTLPQPGTYHDRLDSKSDDGFGNEKSPSQPRVSITSLPSESSEDIPYIQPIARVRRKWKSSLLRPGEPYEKPWLLKKEPKRVWEKVIFAIGFSTGVAIGLYICLSQYLRIDKADYCLVLDNDFTTTAALDPSIWSYDIERGGFGTGAFTWTTDYDDNLWISKEGLHISPTLTTESMAITEEQILNGYTLNLTAQGTCTSIAMTDCAIVSNSGTNQIINPVQSARISTKSKKSIKYGRVEVVAKLPRGDWIWPSIRLLPEKEVYGAWPASGEIDIVQSRGNDIKGFSGGIDTMSSTLHWGPVTSEDASQMTAAGHMLKRTDYSNGYHTFGLEWGEDYLYTYLDGRTLQVFYMSFKKGTSLWKEGKFGSLTNQYIYPDPWSYTGRPNTPFDQPFHLEMDVAVGSTNGWFVAGQGQKPWSDSDSGAQAAFWQARDMWYPTWPNNTDRSMTVKSVKMWQRGKCSSK